MSQPFYQPARQNFSSSQSMQQPQGGFGGFGGGYQMPQQNWGGGFGGGYGSGFGFGGGFQPSFGGGYGGGFGGFGGGFQPQQQFNPFQGGFGGFGGFGGGYNPMFGGIGGLGFNPMMGPQFGMPMQGFGFVEDRPTPQQSLLQPDGRGGFFRPEERRMPMQGMRDPRVDMLGQQFGFASEEPMRAIHQLQSGLTPLQPQQQPQQPADTSVDAFKNSQAYQDAMQSLGSGQETQDLGYSKYGFSGNSKRTGTMDRAYEDWKKSQPVQPNADTHSAMSMEEQARRLAKGPMYGGIGGLGFNPMMGPQFGMPMGQPNNMSAAQARMQSMISPQEVESRMQQFQQEKQRDAELEKQFGISKFGSGLGGFRYTEDYEQSPELGAFKQSSEYQRALQNKTSGDYGMDGPRSVDLAFKDWLYKNRENISSGALGFQSEATKARQEQTRKQMEAQNKYYEDMRNRPKFDPNDPFESLKLMQADLNNQQNSPLQGGGPFGYMPAMLG